MKLGQFDKCLKGIDGFGEKRQFPIYDERLQLKP
jgi:hypothetical protein